MKKPTTEQSNETANEEFRRRIKELCALAEKMGFYITVHVKRKRDAVAQVGQPRQGERFAKGAQREPGEN
jgi:hypothetical protein